MAKVLAAICIVTLIVIVSIVFFLKYRQPKTYSLTATASPNGSISPSGATTVTYGGDLAFTATPAIGYQVDTWSVDGSPVQTGGTGYTLSNIQADHTVEVTFRILEYVVTGTAGPNGSISPSGAVPVNSGADQSFTMTPEAGYQIADVLVDVASVGAVASHTFTNVTADHTIDASFALKTYSLTATAVDGSVTKSPDQASYNNGETVTLEAVPNTGYSFTNWSGDLSDSTNPATLVMNTDKSVTASFALKTYSLTATAVNGEVTKSPDQASYNHGEKVTLEAVPNTGYSFTNWSGDLSGSTNPDTITMDSDKSVTASFNVWELCSDWYKKDYYFISPSVDPKGPSSGKYHVARGGAWGDFGYVLRCSARLEFNPGAPIYYSLYGFGFRVVRSQ